jgi:hypothetical protein
LMFCGGRAIEVGACESGRAMMKFKSGLEAWCFARELWLCTRFCEVTFATLVIERLSTTTQPWCLLEKRQEVDHTTVYQHA